ncbi:substrate-binding domain-containing protein [Chitinibacter fontanus]|uniref:Substrate-binding domain-containing protein n=1 Tax=Chitinibacter fontanus TaxID=1737446 RepID=A0A7D5Z9U9_9NEIS|nr:substrate-binding domain-containing protein [Chitinibacter fontanus]QLI80945.1 substrate-binding domain-containing protein [Chitinibacter fontanus]
MYRQWRVWFVALGMMLAMSWSRAADVTSKNDVSGSSWPQHVGVSVSSLGNPFFVALTRGAQERARQTNPTLKFTVRAAEYSVARQIEQINELINLHVDVLLVSASAEFGMEKVLERARKQGIIVIGMDVRAQGTSQTVLSNNIQAGFSVCDYLARSLGGKGRVMVQSGPQVSSVLDRVDGCKQAWSHYSNLQVVADHENGDGSVWGGHAAMRKSINSHGELDAVFAINDRQALGVLQAVQKAKFKTLIGAVDGSQAVVKLIATGSQLQVSAAQSPETMGRKAVELALEQHQGAAPSPELVLLSTTLVTKDNASGFQAWDAARP